MPMDNKEAYKEMYEMGKRLMEIAEAGGYSEDSEEEESNEGETEMESKPMASSKDKISSALNMFKE